MSFYTFTEGQLSSMFEYDPGAGQILNLSTGRYVGSMNKKSYVIPVRNGRAVHNIPAGKLAWLLQTGEEPKTRVYFIDGDVTNICWDNLTLDVITKNDRNAYEDTEHPNIFYRVSDGTYVVRKGPKEAVFRTSSLKEAIIAQNEYLSTILRGNPVFCGKKSKIKAVIL